MALKKLKKVKAKKELTHFDEDYLKHIAESLRCCPVCGNKTFIKLHGDLQMINVVPHKFFDEIQQPSWCIGPYRIGCSHSGCNFKGSGDIFALDGIVEWWNNLPRKENYGQTWDVLHGRAK